MMNTALQSLIDRYRPETSSEWENALREIVQELALLGLWRSKFYQHAAFYGGTALRIFHGLPRFSEDMDFSLLEPDRNFDLNPHLEAVRVELAGFGFTFEIDRKVKAADTAIESAFLKGNSRINLLEVGAPESLRDQFPRSKKLKIKLEVDTDPPPGADYEVETLLVPIPFQVKLFTLPGLFAGKVHALLCRNWKGWVKGRDFYDFVWYLGREVPCHLAHMQKRLEQTGHWDPATELDLETLRIRLAERFASVDFEQAKNDVRPFIRDPDELALWSREFFVELVDRLVEST
ncbi:MAG: nucleotidyl transferase AbiEii/AbiGii toxin family protein [Verrucomicrobiales bacterium]